MGLSPNPAVTPVPPTGGSGFPSKLPISPISIAITAPYEQAIIQGLIVIQKVMDGQPAEVKAQLWTRWMEFTGPLHQAAVEASKAIGSGLADLIRGAGK